MRNQDEFLGGKPVRIPKALRDELEAAIQAHLTAVEKLTAVLDRADGEGDDEPSLGSQDPMWESTNQENWTQGTRDDREDEHDGREPDVDNEPSLSLTSDMDQERALKNATGTAYAPHSTSWYSRDQDLEGEHDGREPQCEDEGAQCEDEGDLGGF